MAPAAGGATSTPSSSKTRGKRNGVPTKEKLSRAIAMVQTANPKVVEKHTSSKEKSQKQSRQTKMNLTIATDEVRDDAPPLSTDIAQALGNDFGNSLYSTINQEEQSSPRHALTPKAAAAAAAKKYRELQDCKKQDGSEKDVPAPKSSGLSITPRAAAAAAIAAEKRKSRVIREQQEKSNSSSNGEGSSKAHNSRQHQDDVDAAMEFSSAIERDIEASSQTIEQISKFIDTVSNPKNVKKKKHKFNVQVYTKHIHYDDQTLDSSAAVAEIYEERDEPESPRVIRGTYEDSMREDSRPENKHHVHPKPAAKDASPPGYRKGSGDFDAVVSSSSKKASKSNTNPPIQRDLGTAVYAVAVKTHSEDVVSTRKEKPSGFDALLNVAAATLSPKTPITPKQDKQYHESESHSGKSLTPKEPRKDGSLSDKSKSRTSPKNSEHASDPPSALPLNPETIGMLDELQSNKGKFSFESRNDEEEILGTDDDASTNFEATQDPLLLSQISAFIDKVEQKNGKKPVNSMALYDVQPSFADTLDDEALAQIFDQPITPRRKAPTPAAKNEKTSTFNDKTKTFKEKTGKHPIQDEKVASTVTGKAVVDTQVDAEFLDKKLTWLEMERILNQFSGKKGPSGSETRNSSSDQNEKTSSSGANQNEKESSSSGAEEKEKVSNSAAEQKEKEPSTVVTESADSEVAQSVSSKLSTKKALNLTVTTSATASDALKRRAADPPSDVDNDEVEPRPRVDPPAETVSTGSGSATPRHRGLSPDDAIVIETEDASARKPLEPSPRHAGDEGAFKPTSKRHEKPPAPENTFRRAAGSVPTLPSESGLRVDAEQLVFVDLTSVNSQDICKEKYALQREIDGQPKHFMDADIEYILSMADDAPTRTPRVKDSAFKLEHVPSDDELASLSNTVVAALSQMQEETQAVNDEEEEAFMKTQANASTMKQEHLLSVEGRASESNAAVATKPLQHPPSAADEDRHAHVSGASRDANDETASASMARRTKSEDIAQMENKGSSCSLQPPGEYSVSSPVNKGSKGGTDNEETEREDILPLVDSRLSQILSEAEDDTDPIQSLLFAKNTNVPELTANRKEAGLSLIQLTLNEVKNFVDANNFDGDTASIHRIENLEQLDQQIPSILSDLRNEEANHLTDSTAEEVSKHSTIASQVQDDCNQDEGQEITVTYDFQPAPNANADKKEDKPKPLKLKTHGKKGQKRKFLTDEQRSPKNNWFTSLDNIFSCKQPSKKNDATFAEEAVYSTSFEPTVNPNQIHGCSIEPETRPPLTKNSVRKSNTSEYDGEGENKEPIVMKLDSHPSPPQEESQAMNLEVGPDETTQEKIDDSNTTTEKPEQIMSAFPESEESRPEGAGGAGDEDDDYAKNLAMAAEMVPNASSCRSFGEASAKPTIPGALVAGTITNKAPISCTLQEQSSEEAQEIVLEVSSSEDSYLAADAEKSTKCEDVQIDQPGEDLDVGNSTDQQANVHETTKAAENQPLVLEQQQVEAETEPEEDKAKIPSPKDESLEVGQSEPSEKVLPLANAKPIVETNQVSDAKTSEASTGKTDSQEPTKASPRSKKTELFKFASQSDSIQELEVECHDSSVQVQSHDGSGDRQPIGTADLATEEERLQEKASTPALSSAEAAEVTDDIKADDSMEEMPDKYQPEYQPSLDSNDEGDANRKPIVDSPRKKVVAAEREDEPSDEAADSSNAWEHFVDLTGVEDEEDDDVKQAKENAWLISPKAGEATEADTRREMSPMQAKTKNKDEADVCQLQRDDQTPRMHQSKRFDFIDDVDEDENIDAYFSRMTSLKQGGHLPNLDINALGSYAEKRQDEDPENIEVDLDVGFVKKSLAPALSEDHKSWNDDDNDSVVDVGNRYISLEESIDEEDVARNHNAGRPRLDTISDDEDELSSFVSSKGSSVADNVPSDGESLGANPDRPIVVDCESASLTDGEDTFPLDGPERMFDGLGSKGKTVKQIADISSLQSLSYESDNDEWLRKRDLATRKTQNPSSWLTRTTSEIQSKLSFVTVETPKPINGVASAKKLLSRQPKLRGGRRRNPIPSSKVWKLSYKERTKDHPGYFDVDFFSLFDSSAVGASQSHHLDAAPWESRDVRQHFLHDHSIGFSKNWFGKAQRIRGNDRVRERVSHPKSMEMPMENKPHPEEWTKEWYKTWERPNNYNSRSVTSSYSASHSGSATTSDDPEEVTEAGSYRHDEASSYVASSRSSHSECSFSSSASEDDDFSDNDDESLEDTPQCGTLINVKPKIGERVSRIHPDYTSQLRRSRWRKKYFPRGTFPYDR